MKTKFVCCFFLLLPFSVHAEIQSLCEPTQKTLFSAYMGKIKDGNFVRNGKLLSFCSNSLKEPLSTLVYKYGSISKTELSISAPQEGLFKYSIERNSPRGIDYSLSISRGNVIYRVNTCNGMTCDEPGTTLKVIQAGKEIASIIADNDDQIDAGNLFGGILNEQKPPISKVFTK